MEFYLFVLIWDLIAVFMAVFSRSHLVLSGKNTYQEMAEIIGITAISL